MGLSVPQLQEILKAFPQHPYVKVQLIYNLFICQDFKEINRLNLKQDLVKDLSQLSRQFAPKLHSNGLLSVDDFCQLISQFTVRERMNLSEKMLAYYSANLSKKKVFPVIKTILTQWNPNWNEKGLLYDDKTATLTISSNDLKFYKSPTFHRDSKLSILRFLPLNKITFNHLNLSNLKQFENLEFRVLDISNCKLKNLNTLEKLQHVRKVFVNSQQAKLINNLKTKDNLIISVK